ncbi:hypothetical protein NKI56_31425 [Mesorhizobium sp. M0622]|uniref:hypothetical protein n=1 Tax=unclassified Mesorhizobium TaxID=325217 RepID=UPI003337F887
MFRLEEDAVCTRNFGAARGIVGAMTIEPSARAQVDSENLLAETPRFDGKGQGHFKDQTVMAVPDFDCDPTVRKAIPGHLGQCAKGFFPDQREIVT